MKKQTDLAALKQLARVFLMMDPEPTEFSPMVVKHPFTDSGMTAVKDGSGYRVVDIMVDDAALTLWRDNMAEIIDNAKNPRHICMMLTKSYRFAFLKHAMPHFSQKVFLNTWPTPGSCVKHRTMTPTLHKSSYSVYSQKRIRRYS